MGGLENNKRIQEPEFRILNQLYQNIEQGISNIEVKKPFCFIFYVHRG
jgi:hypothetical protein